MITEILGKLQLQTREKSHKTGLMSTSILQTLLQHLHTSVVEINKLDVIYVGSSTDFVNVPEGDSFLYESVNPAEQETLLHVNALENSGIVTFHTESASGMECSSILDDT